jgi:hypothetical protein
VIETWNGSLVYTVYNIRAVYTTSVICPHMEGLKTGVNAWRKFAVLTLVYNFSLLFLCLMQPTHLVALHFFSVGGIPLGK